MHKVILAGYGGQGMLLCGQILAYAAMKDGFNVTWLPTYGPEMRGGAAACSVVISEKPIGSPVIERADAVIAMSQPAFDRYQDDVADGGFILYNEGLVTISEKRENVKYVGVDYAKMASDLGNAKTSNMIVLGSVNALLSCVGVPALKEGLQYKFGGKKAEVIALNEKAIEVGAQAVQAYV